MSRRMVRGKNRMPDYWEWSCDLCGKTARTNSQATRPPGWVPKGRTTGSAHDFCSPEHEAEYNSSKKPEEAAAAPAPEEAKSET